MVTSKEYLFTAVREHKEDIYAKFNVKSLAVFGSVAKGNASINSDIDALVSYTKTAGIFEFLNLKDYLETLLGKTC